MFSKKQHSLGNTSNSTANKRRHTELNAFTPDELTDGLNRLSVNRYQKLARKSAQDFVKSEPSLSMPLTPMQQQGESIRFMDFLVQTTVDKHSRNPEVLELAKTYRDAPQTPSAKAAALTQFEKEAQPCIEQEQRFNAGVEMGFATSNICSQIGVISKNKELIRFANGIGAMTQAVNGVNQICQAATMISQASAASAAATTTATAASAAASGATAMASGAMMLGAVGAVVSAGIIIYSLCSEEDEATDNGLSQALTAIHSAVMAMWEDTRRNFEIVFEKLDLLDKKITEMERQNWKRFVASMRAIHYYGESNREQLKDLKTTVQGSLNYSHQSLESYMQTFARSDSREVVAFIGKVGQAKCIDTLATHSNKLEEWLTQRAAISGYSGSIPTRHGKLNLETAALITLLQNATAPEVVIKGSLPLGLYASLAQSIDPYILFGENLDSMINPQDWNKVLASYIEVIQTGIPLINESTLGQQEVFVTEVRTIKNIPLLVLNLLSGIRDSDKLWTKLIRDYHEAVIGIQTQLSNALEEGRQKLNFDYDIESTIEVLRLEQSAKENFERTSQMQPIKDAFMEKNERDLLKKIPVIVDNSLRLPITRGFPHQLSVREDEYLTEEQIRIICNVSSDQFKLINQDHHFLIAQTLKLANINISAFASNLYGRGNGYCSISDFKAHVVLSVFFNNKKYSFLDVTFSPGDGPTLNRLSSYSCFSAAEVNQRTGYEEFSRFIDDTIEQQVLQPRRKLAAAEYLENIDIKLTEFECARLKLLSFIKLLNPQFEIDLNKAQRSIYSLLHAVKTTGIVKPLQELLNPDFGANLLQSDLGFPVTSNPSQSELVALVNTRVRQQPLYQHRLWQTIAHAYASIEMLEQKLKQAPLMKARIRQDKIEETIDQGMSLLSAHHQQFSDGLQTMRSVIKQAQALVSTQAISETTLIEQTKALSELEVQFTYRIDAAIDLNQKISAGYEAPDVDLTSIETPIILSEARKAFLAQRWMKKAKSMVKFSFPETIGLLEKGIKEFPTPQVDAPAVLFVGRTQVGKSTLANAATDVLYESAQNQFGRPCVQKSRASTVDEFAKTGQGQASETILPNVQLSPDGTCYLVDMPGYQDTRNTPHRINAGIVFQRIQEHYKKMKGIVIVCEENEFLINGFGSLRTTLENVGRMLPVYFEGAKNHVILGVTNSRGEATQTSILTVLKTLLTTEYSSAIDVEGRAVKRALLYLTKSPERIVFVNAANPASVAEFYQKIKAMDESDMSEFNLTPSSEAMSLIKIVLQTIVSAERELTHRIQRLQFALTKQCKTELLINIEVLHELAQLQVELQSSISLLDEDERDIPLEFTGLVEDQKTFVHRAKVVMGTLSQLFNTADEPQEIATAEELVEKYAELEANQVFFNRMREIVDLILSDSQGYVTDDEAEELLEQDTRGYLAHEGIAITGDVDEESDDEGVEPSIWIKPDETPGLRTLRPAYRAVGQRQAFLQFFNEKGYAVTHVDEEISVQLCTKMNDL